MCGGSEAGSYLRLIDFVYLSTLGLRVIKKKTLQTGHTAPRTARVVATLEMQIACLDRLRGEEQPGRKRMACFVLGPAIPSFRALSGRLKFTVRPHKFNQDSLLFTPYGGNSTDHTAPTRPHGGIKWSGSIALICTTSRRISTSASTNQGRKEGDLILL